MDMSLIVKLLNSDIKKLEKSSLDKDKKVLAEIRKLENEQHLAIWEGASHICYRSNIISEDELQEHLKSIDIARKTGKIPKLYYQKASNDGKNKVGTFSYHPSDNNTNHPCLCSRSLY